MTKDKFKVLCDQVLIPKMGNLLHAQLTEIVEMQGAMAGELLRLGNAVDLLRATLSLPDNEDSQK